MLKGIMSNVVQHAEATGFTLDIALTEAELVLQATDNGRGFDPAQISGCSRCASGSRVGRVTWMSIRLPDKAPGSQSGCPSPDPLECAGKAKRRRRFQAAAPSSEPSHHC